MPGAARSEAEGCWAEAEGAARAARWDRARLVAAQQDAEEPEGAQQGKQPHDRQHRMRFRRRRQRRRERKRPQRAEEQAVRKRLLRRLRRHQLRRRRARAGALQAAGCGIGLDWITCLQPDRLISTQHRWAAPEGVLLSPKKPDSPVQRSASKANCQIPTY